MKRVFILFSIISFAAGTFAADFEAKSGALAKAVVTPDLISLQTTGDYERYILTVRGPEDVYFQQEFDGVSVPFIEAYDLDGNLLPDGFYTFELRAVPILSQFAKEMMAEARETGDYTELMEMRATGEIPAAAPAQSGNFTLVHGFIVLPEEEQVARASKTEDGREEGSRPGPGTGGNDNAGGAEDIGEYDNDAQTRDQVIGDDLIVTQSICVGTDCNNGESFGFDTIRLKENNLRIKFLDTSTGSFPSNDWQLTANDSNNGGANRFSIDDITGNKTPFTIIAGAPNNSFYMNASGNIGLGTNSPVVELHVVDGDSPTLRLEQNASSGFTPQTWDLAGNETNFFVRDVTNGSKLPFKIVPNAPTNSLYVNASGNVGLGTASPDEKLDVEGGNLKVQDNASNIGGTIDAIGEDSCLTITRDSTTTNSAHQIATFTNNGSSLITLENTATSNEWFFGANAANFIISKANTGGEEITIFPGGNVTILGTLTQSSDVNMKEGIEPIQPSEVLNKVLDLPISSWTYITDETGSRHLGPMAQDFYSAFRLGYTDKGLSSIDTAGVALGAIQGLHQVIEQKDSQIQALQDQLKQQESRLKALEDALLK